MNRNVFGVAGLLTFCVAVLCTKQSQSGHKPGQATTPDKPVVTPVSHNQPRPKIEVVFVLDNTGSMSGLIQTAKEKIWSIAGSLAQSDPAPDITMGLIGYRDRGDDYVTRRIDPTTNLDSVYEELMTMQADGGGDSPESVNQALHEAVTKMPWSSDPKSYRVIFLVGDCPPHMDYEDDVKYQETCALAKSKGLLINTIQMGNCPGAYEVWTQIAKLTNGQYLAIDQNASDIVVSTPYDDKIAALADSLDATVLYYGSASERHRELAKAEKKTAMKSRMSTGAKARRGVFNSSKSGEKNLTGSKELIADFAEKKVDLGALKREELPELLQSLSPEKQTEYVQNLTAKRSTLKAEIAQLQKQRQEFIEKETAATKTDSSFTDKVFSTAKRQAMEKGIGLSEKAMH